MATKKESFQKHVAKSIKRKNFTFIGDVVVNGDVEIDGSLIVAGDLMISGSCRARNIYCLGHLTVTGPLRFGAIRLPGVLECQSDAHGERLEVVADAGAVFGDLEVDETIQAALAYASERAAQSLFVREKYAFPAGGGKMVNVKGDLKADDVRIEGSLGVGEDFLFDVAAIHGSSTILGSVIGNRLVMTGSAYIEKKFSVRKRLRASSDVTCSWSCTGGELEVHGDLEVRHAIVAKGNLLCGGHVKSDNRIQVRGMLVAGKSIQSASSIYAGKGLSAGEEYGIYAGMCVPLPLHAEHGYIAAHSKPARIRSGLHVDDKMKKRFRKLSERQLVHWPSDDYKDGVY